MTFISNAELRAHLRMAASIGAGDPDDDALDFAIAAAESAIKQATNRTFEIAGGSDTQRYFTAVYDASKDRYAVSIDDTFDSTITVALDTDDDGDADDTVTSFRKYPLNAAADGKPFTTIALSSAPLTEGAVMVTADWGWSAVPDTIKQAALLQAARYFKRRDAAFGVAGSPELGNEMRLLSKLDPDVELLVSSYRRWWTAF